MKRTLSIIITLMLTLTLSAQDNITTFMGIPVDGTREVMTAKLLKNGVVKKDNNLIVKDIEGGTYFIQLKTHKGKVYRVSMVETKGTDDVNRIIGRFDSLVEEYRENTALYCEFEYNHPVIADSIDTKEQYIKQGCFFAEFFQKADPQLYSKRIGIQITDRYGDYRIERLYDNVYNMPEGK